MRHLKKITKGILPLVLLLLQIITPLALSYQHYNVRKLLKGKNSSPLHEELAEKHFNNSPSIKQQKNSVNHNKTEIGSKLKKLLDASSKENTRKEIRVIINIRSRPHPTLSKIHERWRKQINTLKQRSSNSKKFFRKYEEITDTMRRDVYHYLRNMTRDRREKVKRRIKKLGGQIHGEIITINSIVAKIKVNNINSLKNSPLIEGIHVDRTIKATLNVAANTTNVPTWWRHGYNGSSLEGDIAGAEIAVLDTGINASHPALQGQVIAEKNFLKNETTADLHGHGTHVAGIVASTDETYRGIAYGANLINGKVMNEHGTGSTSYLMEAAEWAVTSPRDTAEVISTSLGIPYDKVRPDGTSEITKFVDAFVEKYKVIWATAAGNAGREGSKTINPPGDAYNAITVGATYDKGTYDRSDDSIPSYSSRGPTADGRVKPDVVAPGTYIKSANANFRSDGKWKVLSGTSMATPMVSGAAAVMLPYIVKNYDFTHLNLPIKALLINFAQDMGEDRTAQGFGYMDLKEAWQEKQALYKANVRNGEEERFWINLEKGESFTASIVWNRKVKKYQGEFSTFYPVSDLDLNLNLPNGSLLTNSSSINDTVEKIHVKGVPKGGLYELVVKGKDVSQEVNTEKFTIAASHRLLNISLKVNLKEIEGMLSNKSIKTRANITNMGDGNITNLTANFSLPDGFKVTEGDTSLKKETLSPNDSWILNWAIAPYKAGKFKYNLTVTSEAPDVLVTVSNELIIWVNKSKITVHPLRTAGIVGDSQKIRVNITNLANATIHSVTTSLSIPNNLTFSNGNGGSKTNETLPPQTPWIPEWKVKLENTGTFRYNITVTSPDLTSSIKTSGKIVVREKEAFHISPFIWILIGIGVIVGVSVLVILVKRREAGKTE